MHIIRRFKRAAPVPVPTPFLRLKQSASTTLPEFNFERRARAVPCGWSEMLTDAGGGWFLATNDVKNPHPNDDDSLLAQHVSICEMTRK